MTFGDGGDSREFAGAILVNTELIYLESPNSFTFELQDLGAVSAIARARGVLTMIDNSYSTPLCQQPLSLGIDMSVHSATKYIGGHSDTMGGVGCGSRGIGRSECREGGGQEVWCSGVAG